MMTTDEDYINDKFSIDKLIQRSWNHRSSEEFFKFLNFISSFHHYSNYNKMLVYAQNRAVTFFGGISFWRKKYGREVIEDARPHVILVPNGPVMMVYDIFDTKGEESPEAFLSKGLGRNPLAVDGEIDSTFLDFAIQAATDYGIKVTYRPLSYFNAAYIKKDKLEICLKEGMNPSQNLSFLMHELGHLFLGHTGPKELTNKFTGKVIKIIGRDQSSTTCELEAETIRFLVCHKIGLETRSAEYMANYIKSSADLLRFGYEAVIKTADRIEKIFIK